MKETLVEDVKKAVKNNIPQGFVGALMALFVVEALKYLLTKESK